ncbi:restriction endonuclease [Mycobacterium sp. 852002-51057_SCH5723018]|uniref:restriction endonuclease n=1 Tax=Mycobacterium sp. 852002-51057_SCH5723018 TaxID=1834094 RepID=UPI0008007EE8|nr:restriction endonuclease [Mycobacterium sp. 852002-51057_SCH5723018]OBG24329.1 restriction endonuclease [Mycobacterium sp. 852002-51057_SCH5723018]
MDKILGSLVVFGFALPWFFTQSATGSVPAGAAAAMAGLVATVGVLLWLSAQRDRFRVRLQRRRDLKCASSAMAAVDEMPGVEFEEFVAAQLRTAGWSVSHTASTGDYGVDLIARKGGTRMAVQCKRLARAVGVAAVQQVVSGALHHRCNHAVVVTNQGFTKAARQLASTHRCRLVGREQLHIWTRTSAGAPIDGSASRTRFEVDRSG